MSKYNVDIKILALDLSKSEDIQNIFNYVEINKVNIDTLVNNAGIGTFGDFNAVSYTHLPIYIALSTQQGQLNQ